MEPYTLPRWPWQDVHVAPAALGGDEALARGCLGWAVALWGFLPVFLSLVGATHGVTFVGARLFTEHMEVSAAQWVLLVALVLFFAVVEGYLGFHRAWSPWVARRSLLLPRAIDASAKSVVTVALAPLFVLGLFFASPRRLVKAYTLYPLIVVVVLVVRRLDAPYHQMLDLAVAAGIGIGTLSLLYHFCRACWTGRLPSDEPRAGDADEPLLT